jgi:hypothetical protein
MHSASERLEQYANDPALEHCEIGPDELSALDAEQFPVGRPARVETLHPEPGGVLVTRELSRRQDGRLVLLVDVYSRQRYWLAPLPMRTYFRAVLRAVRGREREARDVLLLHSRGERRRKQAHLAYLIVSSGQGTVAEQYRAMSALDERLRAVDPAAAS